MSNTYLYIIIDVYIVQECLESEERKLVKAIKVKDNNTDIEGRLNQILDKLRKS